MRRRYGPGILILALAVALPVGGGPADDGSGALSCPQIVRTALATTETHCEGTGRNKVCYGNVRVDALPRPQAQHFVFGQAGDTVDLSDVESLRTSAMDVSTGEWGLALMRLQAPANTQVSPANITLVLMGDTQLEPAPIDEDASHAITVSSKLKDLPVPILSAPTPGSPAVAVLKPGSAASADGRLPDSRWVRVTLADSSAWGWTLRPFLRAAQSLETLPTIDARAAPDGPMHAFYFESGSDGGACPEAPGSGMLVQTPEGVAEVTLLINEVDVQLGSTVFFQTPPGGDLTVSVLEGHADITAQGVTQHVPAGAAASVPLDRDQHPSGPPSEVQPHAIAEPQNLPIDLLERPIEPARPGGNGDGASNDPELVTHGPPTDESAADVEQGATPSATPTDAGEPDEPGGQPGKGRSGDEHPGKGRNNRPPEPTAPDALQDMPTALPSASPTASAGPFVPMGTMTPTPLATEDRPIVLPPVPPAALTAMPSVPPGLQRHNGCPPGFICPQTGDSPLSATPASLPAIIAE